MKEGGHFIYEHLPRSSTRPLNDIYDYPGEIIGDV